MDKMLRETEPWALGNYVGFICSPFDPHHGGNGRPRGARVKSLVTTSYRASSPGIRTPSGINSNSITLFILSGLRPYSMAVSGERDLMICRLYGH